MRQSQFSLDIPTPGPGLVEFTGEAQRLIRAAGVDTGIAHFFIRHTSASLLIQENADPDVQRDLMAFFRRLVPNGDPLFVHRCEGPDDMPAHIKSALTQTTLSVPISERRLALGAWQGLYVFEHRDRPHVRSVIVHVLGA